MYGSQKCCSELAELTVDDIWQITDAGNQELRRQAHSIQQGTMKLRAIDNDGDDCHSKLVLHSLRNKQPVQVVTHQPIQTTIIFRVTVTRHAAAF